MRKIKITLWLVLLLILAVSPVFSQIGGNFSPLQYSVHEYSIEMDNTSYNSNWGIYIDGTSQADIEDGIATELVEGDTYTLIPPIYTSGGRSYFKVQYSSTANGAMALGDYVIGYQETTVGGNICATAVVQDIQVYSAFDVDIALQNVTDAAICADEDGDLKTTDLSSETTIEYQIDVNSPAAGYVGGETWSFNFQIKIDDGGAGTNDTIISVVATGGGMLPVSWADAIGESVYDGSCTVDPSDVNPLTFTVVYNDVPGVDLDVTFKLYDIEGAYSEADVDEATGNEITNIIYALPAVGEITAWE